MDLKDLTPSERMVEILHPGTKEPIGVRVTLMHLDDDRMKKLRRAIQDEKHRLDQRGKYLKSEQIEANAHELCFTALTGWEWYNPTGSKGDKGFDPKAAATFNGEVPTFTKKNVFDIFDKLPWFRDQIGQAMGDDESFFGR
jgi:hypothetical protein